LTVSDAAAPTHELHAELRRLRYALRDIASAESLLPLLESQPNYRRQQASRLAVR
jgi:hypothetical protein